MFSTVHAFIVTCIYRDNIEYSRRTIIINQSGTSRYTEQVTIVNTGKVHKQCEIGRH